MAGNKVAIETKVKGAKEATGEIKNLHDAFTRLQKGGLAGFKIGAGIAATNMAFGALEGVIGGVGDAIKEVTDNFIADQESQNRMRASLQANVKGWDGNTKAIEEYITAQQRLGFDDETLRDSLTVLVGATHDVAKAEKVASIAMDLARFKGIDLRTASEALIKVEGGHYRALAQLGIKLRDGATSEEALTAVQKIASGQAEAYAGTISGRLVVAQVRAKEATEKLGAATAEFSADLETTKADVIEKVVTGLDDWVDALNMSQQPLERQIELLKKEKDAYGAGLNGIRDTKIAELELEIAARAAMEATSGHGDALIGLRQKAEAVPGALGGVTDATDELTDAEKANIAETKRVAGVLDYLAGVAATASDELKKLDDVLFGGAERKGELAQDKKDLADLLAKEPNHQHTRAWAIWNGKVAEAKQRIFDLQYQMAQTAGPAALDDWLRKQRDALSKANKKGRDYLNTLIALNSLNLGPAARAALERVSGVTGSQQPGGFSGKQFAAGGHYEAGVPRMVGEHGTEIDIPDHSGTIIPHGATAAGMGGITINLTVAAPTGTDGRRWGQDVADSIAGSLRQQSARLPVGAGA